MRSWGVGCPRQGRDFLEPPTTRSAIPGSPPAARVSPIAYNRSHGHALHPHRDHAPRRERAARGRMRPTTLEGFVGQAKAVGPGSWLRRAIEHDTLSSVILYGPAGTGKTTLARIIAHTTHAEFVEVSAVTGTVKDLRREDRGRAQPPALAGPPDHPLCGRDPPLQPRPAGRPAPCRGGPHRRARGRHDREPLLRGQLRPHQPQPRRGAHRPRRRRHPRAAAPRRGRRARPRGRLCAHARGGGRDRDPGRRRRPRGAHLARAGLPDGGPPGG